MKHTPLLLTLLVSTPVFADCRSVAEEVGRQDRILKRESADFAGRYGDANPPRGSGAAGEDYVRRLDALIDSLRRDIDGLRWLIATAAVRRRRSRTQSRASTICSSF